MLTTVKCHFFKTAQRLTRTKYDTSNIRLLTDKINPNSNHDKLHYYNYFINLIKALLCEVLVKDVNEVFVPSGAVPRAGTVATGSDTSQPVRSCM